MFLVLCYFKSVFCHTAIIPLFVSQLCECLLQWNLLPRISMQMYVGMMSWFFSKIDNSVFFYLSSISLVHKFHI